MLYHAARLCWFEDFSENSPPKYSPPQGELESFLALHSADWSCKCGCAPVLLLEMNGPVREGFCGDSLFASPSTACPCQDRAHSCVQVNVDASVCHCWSLDCALIDSNCSSGVMVLQGQRVCTPESAGQEVTPGLLAREAAW